MKRNAVHEAVPKKDAFAIMGGGAVYTEDLVPANALIVRVLRSPHPFARILSVDKSRALADPEVACVVTYADLPANRYSAAGENYPGNNPFDRQILDELVRYVGDPVAIVAARTEEAADRALANITVKYEVRKPVLDFETAEENPTIVHPEENYRFQMDIGGDLSHNVVSYHIDEGGCFEEAYAACPVKLDETYYTCANQQAMMETFRAFSYRDERGMLTIVSSTQVPFHARRIIATALGIPPHQVRVIKPRVGGGFGAKQSLVCELFPAVVTWLTGKSAYYRMTRQESFSCGNTRHAFRLRVRLGAETDGTVKALWIDSLENAGAYAEHAVNVVDLSGHKTLPLYTKNAAWRYTGKSVYTNTTAGGAFRGYGATQGCFAVESTVNKMASQLGLDPTEVRLKNLPVVGQRMPAYYNEMLHSCSLDRCIATGKRMIGWESKYRAKPFAWQVGPHRYRGVGMAVTMQGSGLSNLETNNATIRLDDGGFYTLSIGCSDIGTGCDTILAQIAAEVLDCDSTRVLTNGVDTAYSPYDKGSYASCTTYITGNAVRIAAEGLRRKLVEAAARELHTAAEDVRFDGDVFCGDKGELTLEELSYICVNGHHNQLSAWGSFCSEISPPPFVAGFAEVEVDTQTGQVTLCDLVGVVDCGARINNALARVQVEGGFAQGVGMALYEDVHYAANGRLLSDNFSVYKIPARVDLPEIRIAFEDSCEPTGPFGAKSIGEVVINTPSPAIRDAIRNAVGVEISTLPMTAEKVFMALQEKSHPMDESCPKEA